MDGKPLDQKNPTSVPLLQTTNPINHPKARGRVGYLTGDPCGEHHELTVGACCCGGPWPGSMTCHGCRNRGHGADECVDGPPPEGGRYGSGRRCNCQHAPAGSAVAAPEAAS